MTKTILTTIIIFLLLFPSVSAGDCSGKSVAVYDLYGEFVICIPIYYEYDPFWWLKDPRPKPERWKEILTSKLKAFMLQKEVSHIVKDIEVLATMSVLAENFSPDSQKSFYSEINTMAKKIVPEELVIQFPQR